MYATGLNLFAPDHGTNMTLASFGAGIGYFASDNVEVGGSAAYFYISSGSSIQGPGLSGFLRFYARSADVGLFFEPVLEFQYLTVTGGAEKILGPGADAGVEVFLADSWAVRVSPAFRYYKEWASADNGASSSGTLTKVGLNWGISAYF